MRRGLAITVAAIDGGSAVVHRLARFLRFRKDGLGRIRCCCSKLLDRMVDPIWGAAPFNLAVELPWMGRCGLDCWRCICCPMGFSYGAKRIGHEALDGLGWQAAGSWKRWTVHLATWLPRSVMDGLCWPWVAGLVGAGRRRCPLLGPGEDDCLDDLKVVVIDEVHRILGEERAAVLLPGSDRTIGSRRRWVAPAVCWGRWSTEDSVPTYVHMQCIKLHFSSKSII
ncbi:hypothetical protein ACLOJK_019511 [Asimina triloba]